MSKMEWEKEKSIEKKESLNRIRRREAESSREDEQ